eukprot:m.20994 g.20994  ORF g.20994 m.20994 type:complete len:1015 (-) comp6318_c0_seq1:211-3255(-)
MASVEMEDIVVASGSDDPAAAAGGTQQVPLPARASDLYQAQDERTLAYNGRMRSGGLVDAVLVYEIEDGYDVADLFSSAHHAPAPHDSEAVTNMKRRIYFEEGLTKTRMRRALESNQALLEAGDFGDDPDGRAKLERRIAMQKRKIEFESLELEREISTDGKLVFVKLHAPFKALCAQAEISQVYMPLADNDKLKQKLAPANRASLYNKFQGSMKRATDMVTFLYNTNTTKDSKTSYCGPFKWSSLEKFKWGDNPASYDRMFSHAQRSYLINQYLEGTRYGPLLPDSSNMHHVGLSTLLLKKVYASGFSLHDGRAYRTDDVAEGPVGLRVKLNESWSAWRNFYKSQPHEQIRSYFGEKAAFYFLWLGFYTRFLVVAAIVGILVFLSGFGEYGKGANVKELCESNYVMCANCETCDTYLLSSQCSAYKISFIFDNGGTVFFAFFMSLWATLFIEFWKRQKNATAYHWDVMQFDETETQRPQFKSKQFRPNPVTGRLERYYPTKLRYRAYVVTFFTLLALLSALIISVVGVILFRLAVRSALYDSSQRANAAAFSSVLGAVVQLLAILFWSHVYQKLARVLNDYENHETRTKYEQMLTLKIYLFQFVNFYSSIFFVAFFQGRFVGRPGDYNTLFGLRQDGCPAHGCLLELTIQLAIIMIGKQSISNFTELVLPHLKVWIGEKMVERRRKKAAASGFPSGGRRPEPPDLQTVSAGTSLSRQESLQQPLLSDKDTDDAGDASDVSAGADHVLMRRDRHAGLIEAPEREHWQPPWEQQMTLGQFDDLGYFAEFLEMVIQYGFLTLFVASFPLAPLFAVLNNVFEIRIDASKMLNSLRRPFAERAESIGMWEDILPAIGTLAVITNAFVIAVTTSFIPRLVYQHFNDGSLVGFVAASHPESPVQPGPGVNPNIAAPCHYQGYRDNAGEYSKLYYQITVGRLAFVIVFEHFVFFIKVLFAKLVPDVPGNITLAVQREQYQAKLALERTLYGATADDVSDMEDFDDDEGGFAYDDASSASQA